MTSAVVSPRSLLPETFVHFSGIGLKTEQRLWTSGVDSWNALAHTSFARRRQIAEGIERSQAAFSGGEVSWFFDALPTSERWRAYSDFADCFAAVDIETTGLSIYDQTTVIGIEFAGDYRTFIRGANLEDAAEMLREARGVITFNGALFDLPFLARTLPGVPIPPAHIDLRFLARRVGWAGSLKKVEQLAALRRGEDLDEVDGHEATVLWSEFEHGSLRSLRRLVAYNAADTCVLRPIADLVVDRLRDSLEALRRTRGDDDQLAFLFEPLAPSVRKVARRVRRSRRIRAADDNLWVGDQRIRLAPRREVRPAVTLQALAIRMRDPEARIVGIDLTGSDLRPSGWALLEGDRAITGMLGSFDDLLGRTVAARPALVSIDSPLSLPSGRHCASDACDCRAVGGITRHCERELKRRGVNVYPCLIQSMQALTLRGIRLASALRAHGIPVVESYPGAAQDILHIPRKRASQSQLREGLVRFGLKGLRQAEAMTHDELDAATSAIVGAFYLADLYEPLGSEEEDYLIIPSIACIGSRPPIADSPRGPSLHFVVVGGDEAHGRARKALRGWDATFGGWGDYWTMVADHGAGLRAAELVDSPGRKRRRPVFADIAVRADDPQLARKLRRWARDWMA